MILKHLPLQLDDPEPRLQIEKPSWSPTMLTFFFFFFWGGGEQPMNAAAQSVSHIVGEVEDDGLDTAKDIDSSMAF